VEQKQCRKRFISDLGKERFAWLLRQRGVPFWEEDSLESRIRIREGKRPDFCAEPQGQPPILVEVEGLHAIRSRILAVDPVQNLKRLRGPVELAAKQLKPYRVLRIPMIVAVDNARRVGVSLAKIDLIHLLGVPEIRVPLNVTTGAKAGRAHLHHGPGQILSPTRRQYISAVAVNLPKRGFEYIEEIEQERPMRLRVLHNPYAHVQLPLSVFSDPEDEHIGLVDGRWVDLRTGQRYIGEGSARRPQKLEPPQYDDE
jgi:hypothetical protein